MDFSRMVFMNECETNVLSFIGYEALFIWWPLGGSSAPHAGCEPPPEPRKRDGDADGTQKPFTASIRLLVGHIVSFSFISWETLWLFMPSRSCLSCLIGVGDVSVVICTVRTVWDFTWTGSQQFEGMQLFHWFRIGHRNSLSYSIQEPLLWWHSVCIFFPPNSLQAAVLILLHVDVDFCR